MIDLPTWPLAADASPLFIDKGGVLRGGLGASDQRYNRKGSRFGISVTMPPLQSPKVGRQWLSRLIQAKQEGGRMVWPLMGFDPGGPGSILVNGAGQDGSTLNVDGATGNYVFREGQFFSIVTSGVHHIYMVAAETIANDAGQAALPISPVIRVQHADNDVCHFGKPMIEGLVQGDVMQWNWAIGNLAYLNFEIHERK